MKSEIPTNYWTTAFIIPILRTNEILSFFRKALSMPELIGQLLHVLEKLLVFLLLYNIIQYTVSVRKIYINMC